MPRKKAATKRATKSKKDKKDEDQSPASDEPMNESGTTPPNGPAVEDLLSKLPENRFELEVSA